ncbi:F0F1 ATP synthase subunit B [Pseudobutyrivibrio sp.]|uniref:ATP synthase subunit b n=1 Tax=Pseudobutyrivibrio ruminis TaxID=46206 RepID=A0A927UA51_9FIRM|nr:F0F1 ATP synthase subunit B [Pseudobutyrivibrio sp.]MBE5919108.1 F0F1 ATP synthase subunit B [Pseudobutyrivibrio ruminis]MBO5616736.1 F0F1 ATP synthase subunit B [Pseudobutyrivibrio sp.]MBP3260771.1 F0F1 ATP synthase subunit B [Pseudobutyrivibrio sp.]MBQ8489704.1 F0F1 ATP synthase subunit B [Pseudobutyrivibrio sp.]
MERLFDLDVQLVNDVVLLAIAVFFLFLIMSNKLFNPARKLLQDRKDGIARDIADAKKDKEEAEKLRLEYEAKLKDINKERDAILAEARQKALKNETKIISDAKEEAAAIIARANEEAELEKKKVADEVKQEMISVAAVMASKVVAANIDTTIQNTLVEQTLKEMGESTWLN